MPSAPTCSSRIASRSSSSSVGDRSTPRLTTPPVSSTIEAVASRIHACSRMSAGSSRWRRSFPRHCWNSVKFIRPRGGLPPRARHQAVAHPRCGSRHCSRSGPVAARPRLRVRELSGLGPRRLFADPGALSADQSARTGNRSPAGRAGIGRACPWAAGPDRPGPSSGNGAAAPARAGIYRRKAGRNVKVLAAVGTPPGLQSSRVFALEGSVLTPLDPATGEPGWTVDLGSPAAWVGYLSDKVVAASAQRVVGLDPATGAEQWRFAVGMPSRSRRLPDPFAHTEAPAGGPEKARTTFHDFRPVGGRLFCLRGEEELIAIDAESGAVDWSFTSKDRRDQSETLDRPAAWRSSGPNP